MKEADAYRWFIVARWPSTNPVLPGLRLNRGYVDSAATVPLPNPGVSEGVQCDRFNRGDRQRGKGDNVEAAGLVGDGERCRFNDRVTDDYLGLYFLGYAENLQFSVEWGR